MGSPNAKPAKKHDRKTKVANARAAAAATLPAVPPPAAPKRRAGRPPGSRNKATLAEAEVLAMLDSNKLTLVKRCITLALAGDATCMRLVIERITPPLKPVARPVKLAMPLTGTPREQCENVLSAIGKGEISVDEGSNIIGGVASLARVIEGEALARIEDRLTNLEAALSGKGGSVTRLHLVPPTTP